MSYTFLQEQAVASSEVFCWDTTQIILDILLNLRHHAATIQYGYEAGKAFGQADALNILPLRSFFNL